MSRLLAPPSRSVDRLSSSVAARRPLLPPVALAALLASRAGFALAALVATYTGNTFLTSGGVAAKWDGFWYLQIARFGYPRTLHTPGLTGFHAHYSSWAFFPGYPLLVRAVHTLTTLPYGVSALVLNAVLAVVLCVGLWHLCAEVTCPEAADRASLLFWFFPGSAVLSLAYSETLFLSATALSLLWLLRGRWLLAGLAGAVATGTRPAGVAVVLACLVAAVGALRRRQWSALLAPALAPLGLLAFLGYGRVRTGRTLPWHDAERYWHQSIDLSVHLPGRLAANLLHRTPTSPLWLLTAVGLVLVVAALALLLRGPQLPAALLAYLAGALLLTFSDTHVGPRPRFVLAMLPLFVVAGRAVRGRAFPVVLASVASLLPLTTLVYLVVPHTAP